MMMTSGFDPAKPGSDHTAHYTYDPSIPVTKEGSKALPPSTPGVYRPFRPKNHQEVEITFYCSEQRMRDISELCAIMYGDRDFTKSISRFLTAGVHWMEQHGTSRMHGHNIIPQLMAATRDACTVLEVQKRVLTEEIRLLEMKRPRPWWKRFLGI